MTAAEVTRLFTPLREELVKLIAAIARLGAAAAARDPHPALSGRRAARIFSIAAARQIGFNFDEGRLDVAAHPFCSGFGPGDYAAHHPLRRAPFSRCVLRHAARGGTRHLRAGARPARPSACRSGTACSLGIHESQSRMWENFVGRSRAFWEHFYPACPQAFPEAAGDRRLPADFYWRHQRRAALVHPRRGRRSDVQPAHHAAVRAGATADRRRPAAGRRPRRLERNVHAATSASRRPTTPAAACRTSIGAAA